MRFHECEVCKKELGEEMFLFSFDHSYYHAFCQEHLSMFLDLIRSLAEQIQWNGNEFELRKEK